MSLPEGQGQIVISYDRFKTYASIEIDGFPRHWIELSGAYWQLRTGNAMDRPVKQWPSRLGRQKKIEQIISESLTVILA